MSLKKRYTPTKEKTDNTDNIAILLKPNPRYPAINMQIDMPPSPDINAKLHFSGIIKSGFLHITPITAYPTDNVYMHHDKIIKISFTLSDSPEYI